MASGPAEPPPPEQPQDARSERSAPTLGRRADAPEQPPGERFGPLTITRVVKDDGRSLILYAHDEAQTELDVATASPPELGDGQA